MVYTYVRLEDQKSQVNVKTKENVIFLSSIKGM